MGLLDDIEVCNGKEAVVDMAKVMVRLCCSSSCRRRGGGAQCCRARQLSSAVGTNQWTG